MRATLALCSGNLDGHGTAQVGLLHGDGSRSIVVAKGDLVFCVRQLVVREQLAFQRATTRGFAAGVLRMVVGKFTHKLKIHRRVGFQPGHHLRTGIDECRRQLTVDETMGQCAQIPQRFFSGIFNARGPHQGVVGDPDHAAGPGAGTAHLVALLEHQDAGPMAMRAERSRQP